MKEIWHKKFFSVMGPSLGKSANYKYKPHSGPISKLGGKVLRLTLQRSHTLKPVTFARLAGWWNSHLDLMYGEVGSS